MNKFRLKLNGLSDDLRDVRHLMRFGCGSESCRVSKPMSLAHKGSCHCTGREIGGTIKLIAANLVLIAEEMEAME